METGTSIVTGALVLSFVIPQIHQRIVKLLKENDLFAFGFTVGGIILMYNIINL